MSARSSAASADSTSDSPELGFDTPSSVSRTLGAEPCSRTTGPECPSTRTFALSENQRGELLLTDVAHQLTSGGGKPGQGYSAVAFRAKPSPSPAAGADSQESAPASSTSSPASPSLFDLDGFSSRTYPDCSPRTASGTAWRGGFSTAVSSECRSDELAVGTRCSRHPATRGEAR